MIVKQSRERLSGIVSIVGANIAVPAKIRLRANVKRRLRKFAARAFEQGDVIAPLISGKRE